MRIAFSRSLPSAATFLGAILLGLLNPLAAAQPKKKAEPANSAPVLLGTNGGGPTWGNVNELRAAAEKGDPKAMAQFGEVLLRGEDGVPQDRTAAVAMLEKAARAGEASAAFRLGMVFDDGTGVPQDRVRALAYFRAAAAGGAVEALHNIGAAYASARGVRRDYAEALAWLTLARQRGAESSAEERLRTQIQRQPQPAEALARAERRMAEIEAELSQKKMADFLPPETPKGPVPSALPVAPVLAPVAPPASLPPALPAPKIEPPKIAPPVVP